MRVYELFLEATRSAKALVGYRGSLEWIKQNIPSDQYGQYGVTMTMIDKIGVNPRSTYATPIGVYFYPLDFYVGETSAGRTMPFPDNPQYIKIFRIEADQQSYLDLDQLSNADFREFVRSIKSRFEEFAASFPETRGYLSQGRRETDELIDDLVDDSVGAARVKTPAGRLWYVLWQLSSNILNVPGERLSRRNALIQAQRSSVLWNWMFRQLGITAVHDTQGIIHENEPTQGVVFDPKTIQIVRTFPVEDHRLMLSAQQQNISDKLESSIKRYTNLQYGTGLDTDIDIIRKRISKYLKYLFDTAPIAEQSLNDIDLAMIFFHQTDFYDKELSPSALVLALNSLEKKYQPIRANYTKTWDEVSPKINAILKKQSNFNTIDTGALSRLRDQLWNQYWTFRYQAGAFTAKITNQTLRNDSRVKDMLRDIKNLFLTSDNLIKDIDTKLKEMSSEITLAKDLATWPDKSSPI